MKDIKYVLEVTTEANNNISSYPIYPISTIKFEFTGYSSDVSRLNEVICEALTKLKKLS